MRSRACGEAVVTRAPAFFGKPSVMPAFSPMPFSSSVPWSETWCGLPLQCASGMHATLVMRTLVTWAPVPLAAGFVVVAPGAAEPPLDARAGTARAHTQASAASSADAGAISVFAAPLLAGATRFLSCRGDSYAPGTGLRALPTARADVTGSPAENAQAVVKLRAAASRSKPWRASRWVKSKLWRAST